MSPFFRTQRWTPNRPVWTAAAAAVLSLSLCSCSIMGVFEGTAEPISQEEAVAIVNRHADSVASLDAGACEFYWRFFNGPLPLGSDLFGRLKAARGGRIQAVLYEKESREPAARLCADGVRYWQETREDGLLLTGSVNSREPRQEQWLGLHFRPHDVARALCMEPVESGRPDYSVSVQNEEREIYAAVGPPDDPTVERVKVPFAILTVESVPGRQMLREIWIDRGTRRIWSQSYYDGSGKVQISMRYARKWAEIGGAEIPVGVDLYVGSSEGEDRRSFEILFTDPRQVSRNATISDDAFGYAPPAGIKLKEVAEP